MFARIQPRYLFLARVKRFSLTWANSNRKMRIDHSSRPNRSKIRFRNELTKVKERKAKKKTRGKKIALCQYGFVLGAWKCKKVSQTAAGTLPLFDMHFHAWIDTSVWTIIFQHSILAVHFRGSISRYSTRGMRGIRLDFLPAPPFDHPSPVSRKSRFSILFLWWREMLLCIGTSCD